MTEAPEKPPVPSGRKSRNWAIFLALLVFVLLVYGVTIVKIKMGYGP